MPLEVVSLNQQESPCDYKPKRRPVLPVSQIETTIEPHRLILPPRCNPRKKQRHRLPVRLKLFAKKLREMRGFDAHHRQIDAKKECCKQQPEQQPSRGDREAESKQKAA